MSEYVELSSPAGTSNEDASAPLGRRFWFLIWAPLVLVGLGIAVYWHFVWFAFKSNPGLNALIWAVMLWGAFTMYMNVRLVYREDAVFRAGLSFLRLGAWSDEPDPKLGPKAYVLGMLSRLQKLGLGHQVYVQSAAMEPELEALEQYFHQKQELSQYLTGLMVGLGLLGTFVGLLETLIATSSLIATIAGGSAAPVEEEFARVVGGLEKPLAAMGTAFSASMFGLVGSIMLGFQMVIVRKCSAAFVERSREDVLSLAEKTKVSSNVQITERFLATLLADVLEQHKQSGELLRSVSRQLSDIVPRIEAASAGVMDRVLERIGEQASATAERLGGISVELANLGPRIGDAALSSIDLQRQVSEQQAQIERAVQAVSGVSDVLPVLRDLVTASDGVFRESRAASTRVNRMLEFLPHQAAISEQVREMSGQLAEMRADMAQVQDSTDGLYDELQYQGSVVRRLDITIEQLKAQPQGSVPADEPATRD